MDFLDAESGVDRPERPKKKQPNQAIKYCFTWNNYCEDNEYELKLFYDDYCCYLLYGREKCPETNTPHLQGYFELNKRMRFTQIHDLLSSGIWVTQARGTFVENHDYCTKEKDYVEYGEPKKRGRGFGIDKIALDIFNQPHLTEVELIEKYKRDYVLYRDQIYVVVGQLNSQAAKKRMKQVDLRYWQEKCVEKLLAQNDRQILFVVDTVGNTGKTVLAKHLLSIYGDRVGYFDSTDKRTCSYVWKADKENILIFDLARSSSIDYQVLEQFKNGLILSDKYQCILKCRSDQIYVVVFTNQEPDKSKLSLDRFDILKISSLEQPCTSTATIEATTTGVATVDM